MGPPDLSTALAGFVVGSEAAPAQRRARLSIVARMDAVFKDEDARGKQRSPPGENARAATVAWR
jgi:hypothetical protein